MISFLKLSVLALLAVGVVADFDEDPEFDCWVGINCSTKSGSAGGVLQGSGCDEISYPGYPSGDGYACSKAATPEGCFYKGGMSASVWGQKDSTGQQGTGGAPNPSGTKYPTNGMDERCFMNKYDCWSDCFCMETTGLEYTAIKGEPGVPGYKKCFDLYGGYSACIWGHCFYNDDDGRNDGVKNGGYAGLYYTDEKFFHPYECIAKETKPEDDKQCEDPNSGGDPHFKTWTGKQYDFHGACDLVLLSDPTFMGQLGFDMHIRTKAMHQYSFIESVAIKIGEDVLEIGSYGESFFNGVEGAEFPLSIGDHMVTHVKQNAKNHLFQLILSDGLKFTFKTHKEIVSISVHGSPMGAFRDSYGMLGAPANGGDHVGTMVARDGVSHLGSDPNAFAMEWQVRDNEPKLFQDAEHFPQYPQACVMPDLSTQEKRRLGEQTISAGVAEIACAEAGRAHDMDACIFDIIATGDLEMATAGAF